MAIQHSGLSDGERHDQWHRIRRGDVDVVVGTRSAVFAPLGALGLVIVDEEHDGSYKQEETPRYNGRDVAVMRARQAGALVVLGSATPSMESYQNAQNGRYDLVTLDRRVLDRPLADVQHRRHARGVCRSGAGRHPEPRRCATALRRRLARGEQAIVLLNRRGFATSVFCRQCARHARVPQLQPVADRPPRGASRALPLLQLFDRAAEGLRELRRAVSSSSSGSAPSGSKPRCASSFPQARVARVDRDTIRRRGAIAALLARFAAGELDVLVGTQMIAKGHDFPRVTLVGVISADVGLGLADFRAGGADVPAADAGRRPRRARRDPRPSHRADALSRRTTASSMRAGRTTPASSNRSCTSGRRCSIRRPWRSSTRSSRDERIEAAHARRRRSRRSAAPAGAPYRVLGPAPAPLSRLKGEHRAQFFMKGTHRGPMRQALLAALAAEPGHQAPDHRRRRSDERALSRLEGPGGNEFLRISIGTAREAENRAST